MPKVGFKFSEESKNKMRAAKAGRKTGPKSAEHRAAIGAAHRGRVHEKKHQKTCACGADFLSASPFAKFCSRQCKRAARGHGLRHAPQFSHFVKHCAICRSVDDLVGDHDHVSGAPRGILCRKCNLAIGNMMDSPRLLRIAANYLERTKIAREHPVVYVSGPITGYADGNRLAFDRAAASLATSGYSVVNPHEVFTEPSPPDPAEMQAYWQRAMRADIKQLVDCTHIALLPGWEKSRGARLEKHIADALGMQVVYIGAEELA